MLDLTLFGKIYHRNNYVGELQFVCVKKDEGKHTVILQLYYPPESIAPAQIHEVLNSIFPTATIENIGSTELPGELLVNVVKITVKGPLEHIPWIYLQKTTEAINKALKDLE